MPTEYQSIKEDVLAKLEANLEEIRLRFGIETIGIFGSVARGEDTKDSDVDILYRFSPDRIDYRTYLDLHEYLEALFGRRVDLIPLDNMRHSFKKYVEPDMIVSGTLQGEA